jgi:hypothetical protein
MKRISVLLVLLALAAPSAMACKLCEEQQPKWLRGVVHGPGPRGTGDYLIMGASILIVLVVLFYSIKFLVKPGESDPKHVKYSILHFNDTPYGK